jgi:hypothetical protein
MCCYSCTPQGNTRLDLDTVKDYIRQAHERGDVKTISFSGGEAVLHYNDLRDSMKYAQELGLKSTLVTNGFWGSDVAKGYEMLKGLVEVGLQDVSMSVDRFHQEYVPIESVRNAIRIAERLGVLSTLSLMDTRGNNSVSEILSCLRPEIYQKNLIVYPCSNTGAAVKNIPANQFIRVVDRYSAACPYENDIVILFDGKIMFCCSQYSHKIPIVWLGHISDTSLEQAVTHLQCNDYLYLLLKYGFRWYIGLAWRLGFKLREKYSVSCELCYELFTNEKFLYVAGPHVKREADRIRLEKLLKPAIEY